MRGLRQIRSVGLFGLLISSLLVPGCGFRALTEKDIVGTYEASADWGSSTLVLHADHSFDQAVTRNDHTQTSIKGTWQLDFVADKPAAHGILALKPFLDVEHDIKGDLAGGAVPSIGRGFLWGVSIGADPDYGISFEKK
jgi:hypothetical protein